VGRESERPGAHPRTGERPLQRRFDVRRLWAYARREATEILRDRLRVTFALLGPMILMMTFGYGISFDVENLPYAVFDQDRSRESRELLESFAGSRYFTERPEIASADDMEQRLRSGELRLAIEVPPDFGRDLLSGHRPEIGVWIDGAMPFRAETIRGYVTGLGLKYAATQTERRTGRTDSSVPVVIETRFRYNQAFRSVDAIVPGVIMLMLILIPAMLTAVAVAREKEYGSIANFRSTPVSGVEFLIGKQLPYVFIGFISFISLVLLALFLFGVPLKGSLAILAIGALLYVFSSTAFGLLVSSFTRTQISAFFATAIIAMVPAINFSGLLVPTSSLSGAGRAFGLAFPSGWFQHISIGTFAKSLGIAQLWPDLIVLAGFGVAFITAAVIVLRKQEA
jgi:ribosome-dependent ATPase